MSWGRPAMSALNRSARRSSAASAGATEPPRHRVTASIGADGGGSRGFPSLKDRDWLYGGEPEAIKASITDAQGRLLTQPTPTREFLRRYGVDAAILYSDIVVPAAAIGFGVDVAPGIGPVVAEPSTSLKAPRTLVTMAWRAEKPTRLWVGSMV